MGMDQFTPPEPFPFKGKIAEEWRKWKQELTLYITTTKKDKKSDLVTRVNNVSQSARLFTFCVLNQSECVKLSIITTKGVKNSTLF